MKNVKGQGHRGQTQPRRFLTITPVWIHWWLWNDAQSLKQHRRRVMLFFEVIGQISRWHRTKQSAILSQIEGLRTVTPFRIYQYLLNEAQSFLIKVIHQISRSHRLKINDLISVWGRLLGRSQLSNPSDLPFFQENAFENSVNKIAVSKLRFTYNVLFMTKTFSDFFIEISFRQIPESFIEDKSALVQAIDFCCEATTIDWT